MTDENITPINTYNNSPQLSYENVVRSYQSIYHSRLNIKYSITKIFQNLLNKFESLRKINKTIQSRKIHKIIVDLLTKLYLTLKRWEKSFNNRLSIALHLLCKLNDYQNQYQSQQKYYNKLLVDLSQNNKRTNVINQLKQTMNNLKENYNLKIIEYNTLIMTLKFYILYLKYGVVFFNPSNMTDQEKGERNFAKSINSWLINLKLRRTISSLYSHSWINIDSVAKHTDTDYLRDQYNKVINDIKGSYKHLLDRITLDVDENYNIYGEKYNYKNHVNELDNLIKIKFLEKLLDKITDLRNQLHSYKIKINYDFEEIEKLQKLLIDYTNSKLIDQNKKLRKNLKLLEKKVKLWTLMINRVEWTIVMKENMLNDVILESKINLEKRNIIAQRLKKQHRKQM